MAKTLIALLEWELAAALAREAELRRRATAVVDAAGIVTGGRPRSIDSDAMAWVNKRALISLRNILDEPADDCRLRQRLSSARYEAALHAAPELRMVIDAMEHLLIAKSAALGALRAELAT